MNLVVVDCNVLVAVRVRSGRLARSVVVAVVVVVVVAGAFVDLNLDIVGNRLADLMNCNNSMSSANLLDPDNTDLDNFEMMVVHIPKFAPNDRIELDLFVEFVH